MLYIALIGDLIESKQLKNRKQAQKDLQNMMAVLNRDYQDGYQSGAEYWCGRSGLLEGTRSH